MHIKRKEFIQLGSLATASMMLPKFLKAFEKDSVMVPPGNKVVVILQLSGGNDGLNMVIPISTYNLYNAARANIAIPENRILRLNGYTNSGLHPSMTGLQNMYNDTKLKVVQAVGYPQPNFSHFRATDIWMTASDSSQVLNTGWNGRFLDY